MDFIHRPYSPGETVAALATAPGEGGIAIIRISGEKALQIAATVSSPAVLHALAQTFHLATIRDAEGKKIDEAVILVFHAPKSYTGEDTVEIQCHGGYIASKKVLEAVLAAGALPASPGEFTFKAFMNGKIDLVQAEAVQKMIGAKNAYAFEAAGRHLEGALSKKLDRFQKELIRLAAIFEAWVDFPEEGIEFAPLEQVITSMEGILHEMEGLLDSFHDGKKVEDGISLCIVGPPNAGKSSLMNALLGSDRAIVTPIAGTTRDVLREDLLLNGLHFRLIDTAGIRETDECIEKEGIRRSKEAAAQADVILLVLDGSKKNELPEDFFELFPQEKTLLVWNKKDRAEYQRQESRFPHVAEISARDNLGMDHLKQAIDRLIWHKGAPPQEEAILTNMRHQEALLRSTYALQDALNGLKSGSSPEFLTQEIKTALTELGRIRGMNITEDILSSIFSQFCVGK